MVLCSIGTWPQANCSTLSSMNSTNCSQSTTIMTAPSLWQEVTTVLSECTMRKCSSNPDNLQLLLKEEQVHQVIVIESSAPSSIQRTPTTSFLEVGINQSIFGTFVHQVAQLELLLTRIFAVMQLISMMDTYWQAPTSPTSSSSFGTSALPKSLRTLAGTMAFHPKSHVWSTKHNSKRDQVILSLLAVQAPTR